MYNQIDSNKRKTWLLIILFIAFIAAIGWAIDQWNGGGTPSLVLAGGLSIVMSLGGYFAGDKLALATAGARGPIKQIDNPYVYRMVENLAITSGLPMPKVYLIAEPGINAFATGRDPKHASIAVTSGAIEKLENEELEGVLAHELAHIKNYDIRLMTLVIVLVGLIALLSDWFVRMSFHGGSRDRKTHPALAIAGLVLIILAPIIAQLIKLAVSRRREFLADASGALLTRYPEGLARALEKIGMENRTLSNANNATAHLYFASPFGAKGRALVNLFSTHPPLEQRVAELRKMA